MKMFFSSTIIKKQNQNCWYSCREIETQYKMVQVLWKVVLAVPKKIKQFDPAIPLLGIITKELKVLWNTSTWDQCIVRSNQKCGSLEQRKVYYRANQGEQVAHAQKPRSPWWFSGINFHWQNLEWELYSMWLSSDWLVMRLTGRYSRNLVLSWS